MNFYCRIRKYLISITRSNYNYNILKNHKKDMCAKQDSKFNDPTL